MQLRGRRCGRRGAFFVRETRELAPGQGQEWLTVAEGASGGNIVDKVVFAPGRQRVLLTLKPLSRGKVLHLDLIRRAFTAAYLDGAAATDTAYRIVSETLRHAPWEEE